MFSKSNWLIMALCVLFAIVTTVSCSKKSTGVDEDEDHDDGIAPSQISDLTVTDFTDSSVTLSWTSPGDDSTAGTAALYDMRYSTINNLWSQWDSATQVTGEPTPKPAGSTEIMMITGLLTDTTYYFALQAVDESDNYSFISNVVTVTCILDFVVDFPDTNLELVIREKLNQPDGGIHKSALLTIDDLWAEERGIVNLSGIEHCENLMGLSLIDNQISDISKLSGLVKLRNLNLIINQISDISPLAGLTDLEQLHLGQNLIEDISSIADLANLEHLRLHYNQINDVGPLSGLADLNNLDLAGNEVSDISPLVSNNGLGSGDEVWLTLNPLSFLSVTEHIPALQARGVTVYWDVDTTSPAAVSDLRVQTVSASSVTLAWTAPGDDGSIGTAYQYEIRYASDSAVVVNWTGATSATGITAPQSAGASESIEVTGLQTDTTYYFGLKARDESNNWSELSNVVRATPFADLVVAFPDTGLEAAIRTKLNKPTGDIYRTELFAIQELQADSMGIADLTGLEYCINIQVLNLGYNQIIDIGPISGLTWLEDLNLTKNQIVDISALAGLTNLWKLYLRENQISNIGPLSGLTDLGYLFCSNNPISDISPLADLTKMVYLELMNNEISDISPLAGLTNLEYLFLWHKDINDVTPLASLIKLRILYVEFNQLSDISPLSGLINLQELYLRYNNISDISPLVANPGLGSGDKVGINHNPLSADSKNIHIPALQVRGVTVYYDP
jgi:Leucine-rich repeat (LRR) protein